MCFSFLSLLLLCSSFSSSSSSFFSSCLLFFGLFYFWDSIMKPRLATKYATKPKLSPCFHFWSAEVKAWAPHPAQSLQLGSKAAASPQWDPSASAFLGYSCASDLCLRNHLVNFVSWYQRTRSCYWLHWEWYLPDFLHQTVNSENRKVLDPTRNSIPHALQRHEIPKYFLTKWSKWVMEIRMVLVS